jgi:hypothetical protein
VFCIPWIFGEDFKAGKVTGKHSGKKGVFKWHLPQPVKVESGANLDGMRKKHTWVMSCKAISCLATLGNLFICDLRGFQVSRYTNL